MNPRIIMALAASAAGLAGLAYLVSGGRGPTTPSSPATSNDTRTSPADAANDGALIFPAGQPRAADVARVELRQGAQRLTFVRLPEDVTLASGKYARWGINEKDNYPALDDKVLGLVRGVLQARSVEPKTSDPALYDKIGVQDPTQSSGNDANANHLVTLSDASGTTIASLIIGRKQDAANWDPQRAVTYVRAADQAQSHAVRHTFTLGMEAVDWLDRMPLVVAFERIRSARIEHPPTNLVQTGGGEVVDIERPDPRIEQFVVKQKPESRTLSDDLKHRTTLMSLSTISLDDVSKAASVDFSRCVTTTFTMFDGVQYVVRSVPRDEGYWLAINVRFDAASFTPTIPLPGNDPEATEAARSQAQLLDEQRKAALPDEAAKLNAQLSPWAFGVPKAVGDSMRATLESLLKPVESPAQ